MKKNYLFGLLSLFTLLFAASCQEEDTFGGASMADTEEVTFTVNTQQVATRAADFAGKGAAANKLYYGVYEATAVDAEGKGTDWRLIPAISALTGNVNDGKSPADITSNTVDIQIKLAKQKLYSVIFWAQSEAPMCTVDWENRNMTVNTDGVVANTENNDVFYAYEQSVKLDGSISRIVNLYRPFAQLNIGTSIADFNDAAAAELNVAQSQVVIKNVPNTLDLATGRATGEINQTYNFAAIPSIDAYNFPVEPTNNRYLALAYVLVDNDEDDKMLVDVDFACKEVGGSDTYTRTFTAVPVQLNYRTNIYGNLLTSNADYNVNIEADINTPDNNVNEDATVRTDVATVAELQAAIDAATTGLTVINFENNIDATTTRAASAAVVTIAQKKDVEIIINGAGYMFNGTFKVHSNSNRENNGPVTFRDINFETSEVFVNSKGEKSFDFIHAVDFGNSQRYSQNITVDGCTFTAVEDSEAKEIAVGIKVNATQNLSVKNCTATNLHSFMQAQSCDDKIVIDNIKVENCKNGISLGNTAYPTISNSIINANAYGIRADGNASRGNLKVYNTTVNAKKPIIVRKMETNQYKVELGDNVLLNTEAEYNVVFTNGDDEGDYVVPTGTYSITGAEEFNVYPTNASVVNVANAAGLQAVLANGNNKTVVLNDKIESVGVGFEIKRDVVFNMEKKEFNAGSTADSKWYALQIYGDHTVEINNANFTRAGIYATSGANVVFNSGVINHKPERSSRYIFYASGEGTIVTINNGEFLNDRSNNSYFAIDNNAIIYVKGGTFAGTASRNNVYLGQSAQLIITGGTFGFNPSDWVADGYVATQIGNTWTVAAK